MNNIVKYVFTVIVSLLSVSAFAQFRVNHNDESPLRKLQFAEVAISNLYVDKVDEERLVENAIRGMLDKLDPHSSYLTLRRLNSLTNL